MAIANTPSLKASVRPVDQRSFICVGLRRAAAGSSV